MVGLPKKGVGGTDAEHTHSLWNQSFLPSIGLALLSAIILAI